MKKILVVTLLSLAAFSLTMGQLACNGASQKSKPATTADSNAAERVAATEPSLSSSTPSATLPEMTDKPQPSWDPNWPCAPQGDATGPNPTSDPVLSRLKNRVDSGPFVSVAFAAIKDLQYPDVQKKFHNDWTQSQKDEIGRYEGTPVSVEGYLTLVNNQKQAGGPPLMEGAREEGKESCNCHKDTSQFHDFHLWLRGDQNSDRASSIVVEITPPVRAHHPTWTIAKLTEIANKGQRVRVSGWLVFDEEHPEQVTQHQRATLWEVHPIIKLEVQQADNKWTEL